MTIVNVLNSVVIAGGVEVAVLVWLVVTVLVVRGVGKLRQLHADDILEAGKGF